MDPRGGELVKRIAAGQNGANDSFCPDGRYGYVSLTNENAVAVVEMDSLEVEARLDVGESPEYGAYRSFSGDGVRP